MIANNTKLSPKNVWGKVVLYLKERKMVALHVACGDITDVSIEGNRLVIRVKDGMLMEMLQEGRRDVESALRWQGLDLNLNIEKIIEKVDPKEEDIKKLKNILGDNLTIYGGK